MKKTIKGFTLVEMIVVIAIIGILAGILVPSMIGYVKKAKIAVAIADARTIKTSVESSLTSKFVIYNNSVGNTTDAFNKMIYLDAGHTVKENAGAFTNTSWRKYKISSKDIGKAQAIDLTIAKGLDDTFSEKWANGNAEIQNPMNYAKKTKTCSQFLDYYNTNFGLVVIYDQNFTVRLLQIYRKGILVSYVNGEYIANTNADAHFVGSRQWDTIYTDVGMTAPPGTEQMSFSNKQIINNNPTNWFTATT